MALSRHCTGDDCVRLVDEGGEEPPNRARHARELLSARRSAGEGRYRDGAVVFHVGE